MKWKGRRQSKNIEDRRTNDGRTTWEHENSISSQIVKDSEHDRKERDVAKELGKHNRNKTTPTPTPRPNQVTPGKWKTKQNIS